MVADKHHAVKQMKAIYGTLTLIALCMWVIAQDITYLAVLPGLFGTIICYMQGLFDPLLWRESNNVSTQRGAVH